jgi:hypothetical protein
MPDSEHRPADGEVTFPPGSDMPVIHESGSWRFFSDADDDSEPVVNEVLFRAGADDELSDV